MKNEFKVLKKKHLILNPLKHNNEYIDYVYGYLGSKIAVKAFKEPNRTEESRKAFAELDKLRQKENR